MRGFCVCVWWKVSILFVGCSSTTHSPLCSAALLGGAVVGIYVVFIHSFPGHLFQTNCLTPCTFRSPRHVQNTREAKLSGSYTVCTHVCVSFVLSPSSMHTNRHELKPHKNRINHLPIYLYTYTCSVHTISTIGWNEFACEGEGREWGIKRNKILQTIN